MTKSPINPFKTILSPVRQQAFADAYTPILRGTLLPAIAYYLFVTGGHFLRDDTGLIFLELAGLSAVTALAFFLIREHIQHLHTISLRQLEILGLTINLIIYCNVIALISVHADPAKLIYFLLMAMVFSITCVTLRSTYFCISLALASLFWFTSKLAPDTLDKYVLIATATAVATFGMATLLRKAIVRQIDARLLADDLTAQAHRLAQTDSLTGVPNRRAIFEHIDDLAAKREPFWLAIVDLDGFKAINDVYGHAVGDSLLCAVVDRAMMLKSPDTVFGRIGGDEFIVIFPGALGPPEIERMGNRMIKSLNIPFKLDHLDLTIGASVGVAHFPSMGNCTAQLYEKADYALYKAKSGKRGTTVSFDSAEDREMKETIALERALREGDLDQELFLQFQPQYSPAEHRFVGFEALARWQSPSLGLVRPDKFIRAAERSGHIRKVTSILFRKGLEALKLWPEHLSLSFNLSAQDISDRSFMLSLLDQIYKSGLPPRRIEFEITETAVMADVETACALLAELRLAGCKIALDDFGSGYSSFEYLDALPLDKVKLDKSFVRKVPHNMTSREIVAGLIALCKKLELRCVLEGVETDDEMLILSPLEPDLIQGFLFGRPMGAIEARDAAERLDRETSMDEIDEPLRA